MTMAKKILRSKLEHHARDKKQLIPPFVSMKMAQIYWYREMLPEFIWIDSLVSFYGEHEASIYYNRVMDMLDEFNLYKNKILLGMVSSFNQVDPKSRNLITDKNKFLIEDAIVKPFGSIINLYPAMPMMWLIKGQKVYGSREDAIKEIREAILRLFPAKDSHSGFCRAVPLNRFFKHNKLFITRNMGEIIKAIEEYPNGDRYRVESFARNVINMEFERRKAEEADFIKWSKYFWNYNYSLAECI